MNTLFFRLLSHEDKAAALFEALNAISQSRTHNLMVQAADPTSFRQVPGSPFASWVSERIRRLFTALPLFEGEGHTVRVGLQTSDGSRFWRTWWEVLSIRILDGSNGPNWREELGAFQTWCRQRTLGGKCWVPFAKGGAYSPMTPTDTYREIKRDNGWVIKIGRGLDFYQQPGSWFEVGANDLNLRKCLETKVDIFRL